MPERMVHRLAIPSLKCLWPEMIHIRFWSAFTSNLEMRLKSEHGIHVLLFFFLTCVVAIEPVGDLLWSFGQFCIWQFHSVRFFYLDVVCTLRKFQTSKPNLIWDFKWASTVLIILHFNRWETEPSMTMNLKTGDSFNLPSPVLWFKSIEWLRASLRGSDLSFTQSCGKSVREV